MPKYNLTHEQEYKIVQYIVENNVDNVEKFKRQNIQVFNNYLCNFQVNFLF